MKHKKSMYSFFLCFVVLAFCTPGISAEKVVQSLWTTSPPNIDGSNSDWEGGTLTLYKKVQVDYAFRNDADNLYVIFIFNEPRKILSRQSVMSNIRQSGITLWLNTDGKKKKKYGIKFGIKTVSADNYIQIVERMMGEPMPEEKKQQIKAKESYQIFHNEVIDKEGEVPVIASGPTAPAFSTGGGRETAVYEFKVPLKRDDSNPVGIGTQPGGSLTIGFEWGGTTKEMRQQKIASQIASGTRGTSGGATSRMDSERGESGSTRLGTMSRLRAVTHIFWTNVKLADKQ